MHFDKKDCCLFSLFSIYLLSIQIVLHVLHTNFSSICNIGSGDLCYIVNSEGKECLTLRLTPSQTVRLFKKTFIKNQKPRVGLGMYLVCSVDAVVCDGISYLSFADYCASVL